MNSGCLRLILPEGVVVDPKWGHIDRAGRIVIWPQFDDAELFVDELASLAVGGAESRKWGCIDKSGKMAVVPEFLGLSQGKFSEGIAQVSLGFLPSPDSRRGPSCINRAGRFICKDRNEE